MTNVNSVDHGNRIGGLLLLVAACGICNGGLALSRLGVKLVDSLRDRRTAVVHDSTLRH